MLLPATVISLAIVLAACPSPGASHPPQSTGSSPSSSPDARPFEWQRRSSAPTARTEVAVAADEGGLIVVAGGFAPPDETVATVEIYDPATDRWAAGPALPVAVNHAMAASIAGVVHVFGGYTSSGTPSNQAFALRNGAWQPLSVMPEGRAAGGAAVAGGKVYVAGGIGPSGLATSTLLFDPGPGTWSMVSGLLRPREHLGVASYLGRVYVVGGRTADGTLPDAEMLDPSAARWQPLPDMPTPRGGIAAAAISTGFVVAPGGEGNPEGNGTFPEVEALDVEDMRWVSLPPMPTPRHGLGVVGIGETLYTLAGGPRPGFAFSGAVEAISLRGLESLECIRKEPTIVGSPGRDVIGGTEKPDVVVSLGGSDVVRGEDGGDVLCGGSGRDRLVGGPGPDRLHGGPGRDRLDGGSGRDRCVGSGSGSRRRCEG